LGDSISIIACVSFSRESDSTRGLGDSATAVSGVASEHWTVNEEADVEAEDACVSFLKGGGLTVSLLLLIAESLVLLDVGLTLTAYCDQKIFCTSLSVAELVALAL